MDKMELSTQLTEITCKLESIEIALKEYADIQKQYDDFRTKLFELMTESQTDKYVSPGGTQFTVVSGTPEKTEILLKFNEDKFKTEHPDLFKEFVEQTEKITKARNSYLRITSPKEKEGGE